jgi:ribosomal protein L11 methyltransferase
MVTNKLEESGFIVETVNKDGEWNCIIAKLK